MASMNGSKRQRKGTAADLMAMFGTVRGVTMERAAKT